MSKVFAMILAFPVTVVVMVLGAMLLMGLLRVLLPLLVAGLPVVLIGGIVTFFLSMYARD